MHERHQKCGQRQLAHIVQGPSAKTGLDDALATRTMGFWLMQVFWFERLNLVSW